MNSFTILVRRDTAANWNDANPVLSSGEIGFDETNNQIRVGDGVNPWGSLTALASSGGGGGGGAVDSVNGHTGTVVLTQDDIGSGTTAKQYTATEKTKLSGIASGAEVNVNADWDSASGDSQILNKPTLGTAAAAATTDFATAAQGAKADSALQSADLSGYVPTTRTVAGHALSGNVSISKGDVGLGSVDNTADADKPVSTDQQAAIDEKYSLPVTGIPSTDLASAVQTSLGKADTALQSAPVSSVAGKTGIVTLVASDVSAVPLTRTVAGKALSADITLTASDVSAVPTTRTVAGKALSADITLAASDVGAVPTTRTVAGKALSADVTLAASDVGAVPTTRTVAGHALSADVTIAKGTLDLETLTTLQILPSLYLPLSRLQ